MGPRICSRKLARARFSNSSVCLSICVSSRRRARADAIASACGFCSPARFPGNLFYQTAAETIVGCNAVDSGIHVTARHGRPSGYVRRVEVERLSRYQIRQACAVNRHGLLPSARLRRCHTLEDNVDLSCVWIGNDISRDRAVSNRCTHDVRLENHLVDRGAFIDRLRESSRQKRFGYAKENV